MRSGSFSQAFLSLFTGRDRAASIVGDLLEESPQRRRGWYSLQVIGIALALCVESIRAAPARCLGLGVAALLVWVVVYACCLAASGLPWYPWNRVSQPEFWVRVAAFLIAANVTAGYVVGRWVSFRGTNGLGPLVALLVIIPLLSVPISMLASPPPQSWVVPLVRLVGVVVFFPLLYLLPLTIGGTLSRWGWHAADRRGAA